MKYVLLFSILLCLCTCRSSSSSLDSSVRMESDETKKTTSQETIQQEKQLLESSRSASNTQIDEYIRITKHNADGSISEVQDVRRTTGRNELADSSRSGSDVSRIEKKDSTDTHSQTKIETDEHRESKGDSRPVQGWKEWGVIALVIGIAVIVIILIAINYVKKYHNKLA